MILLFLLLHALYPMLGATAPINFISVETRFMFYHIPQSRAAHLDAPFANLVFCFDLDGTLVDTAPDLVRVTNETIAKEGLGATHYKTARSEVGYGSRVLIKNAMARAQHQVTESRINELQKFFLKRYAESIADLSQPFRGVEKTLRRLKQGGASLNVCTNKPGYLTRPLLNALCLTHFFDNIVGGDEAPAAKPDARHIFMSAGHQAFNKQIIMVGDSYPDIRAGHNAKSPTILMTYGYTPIRPYRLKATLTLHRFEDILHNLDKLTKKSRP